VGCAHLSAATARSSGQLTRLAAGFFWAFGFPLPFVAAWCVNLYAEGAEGQNPEGYAGSVYEWEPHTVIKTALVGSLFPLASTLVCALIRAHVPPFGRQGKIINGQRQGGLCACCNWYAEDNTVRQQKEDIGQMSGVLGLLFGPFLVITVIGSCLYLVVCKIVILSRFVALFVPLIQKVSLLQGGCSRARMARDTSAEVRSPDRQNLPNV